MEIIKRMIGESYDLIGGERSSKMIRFIVSLNKACLTNDKNYHKLTSQEYR